MGKARITDHNVIEALLDAVDRVEKKYKVKVVFNIEKIEK